MAGKHCFEHPEEKLKLYCKTCGDVICLKCAIKSGKHHSHDYQELDQAFQQYKEDITSSVEPMEKQVAIMEGVLAQVDMRCGDIFDQQTTTEVNIHATFTQLRHFLDVRETGLISKLHKITHNKLKHLAVQREQIKTILARLSSCLLFMSESLRVVNKEDVMMMRANTMDQIRELRTPFQPNILMAGTEADIVFSALENLGSMCREHGQVFTSDSPDATKCYATGKGLEVAMAGKKSTVPVPYMPSILREDHARKQLRH